jgi:hypothetical protein
VIALQSIKMELPPFLCDCIAILIFDKKEYFFGFESGDLLVNLISIIAKNYIFKCKLNEQRLLLNWSYLPFLFCTIALQSINLELPLFFVLDCPVTQIFLKSLSKQLKQYYKNLIFDKKEYFFGFESGDLLVNLISIIAKNYIFKCKLSNNLN